MSLGGHLSYVYIYTETLYKIAILYSLRLINSCQTTSRWLQQCHQSSFLVYIFIIVRLQIILCHGFADDTAARAVFLQKGAPSSRRGEKKLNTLVVLKLLTIVVTVAQFDVFARCDYFAITVINYDKCEKREHRTNIVYSIIFKKIIAQLKSADPERIPGPGKQFETL